MAKRSKKNQSVVINDDVVVIDMRQGKTPGVVRLKLHDLAFAHFHIRLSGEGAALGFTKEGGEFIPIGLFSNAADADRLLEQLRAEMLSLEGYHKLFSLRSFMMLVAAIVTLMLFVWILGKITTPRPLPELAGPIALDEAMPPVPSVPPGVPMDADKKLGVPH
jgi:hypothetical protein